MLEIELIKKLVEALTMWTTPPHYTNDAQDVIHEAVGLAVDTEWEKEIQEILEPEMHPPTLEQLEAAFLEEHKEYTKENLTDLCHDANWKYHHFLEQSDKDESKRIVYLMESLIRRLGDSVSDKVHRRNMQIADLKKQLSGSAQSAKMKKACSMVKKLADETPANTSVYGYLRKIEEALS